MPTGVRRISRRKCGRRCYPRGRIRGGAEFSAPPTRLSLVSVTASALLGPIAEGAMRVYEVMSKKVETVKPNVRASEAKTRMRQKKIHHLVVTENAELKGVVSDRDLGGPKLPKVLGAWTVGDLMTSPVVTVTTRTPIRRAASMMTGRSIGSLIVTSANGKVAGIVTVSDLLTYLLQHRDRQATRGRRRPREREEQSWED